VDAYISKICM